MDIELIKKTKNIADNIKEKFDGQIKLDVYEKDYTTGGLF